MKLKIEIRGWGGEYSVHEIPRKAYKYIKEKFKGDIEAYAEAMDAGEVPEEYQMLEGMRQNFETDGDYYQALGMLFESSLLTVENEDTGEKYIDGERPEKFADGPTDIYDPKENAKRGQHFVLAQSIREGWLGWSIETNDKKFNKKKLKLSFDVLRFNSETYRIVTEVMYDDEDSGYSDDGCMDVKCCCLEIE